MTAACLTAVCCAAGLPFHPPPACLAARREQLHESRSPAPLELTRPRCEGAPRLQRRHSLHLLERCTGPRHQHQWHHGCRCAHAGLHGCRGKGCRAGQGGEGELSTQLGQPQAGGTFMFIGGLASEECYRMISVLQSWLAAGANWIGIAFA